MQTYFFFFSALAVTGLCEQQDAHLQQRHRHAREAALLSPRASPGLQSSCNRSSELRTGDDPDAISPLHPKASTADFHGKRSWYKHPLSTAEYHVHQGQAEMKAFSK